MRLFSTLALSSLLALAPLVAAAQQSYVNIEQRLSAEQMQATGLDALSSAQLALLNQLLSQEQAVVAQQVEQSVRDEQKGKPAERASKEPISSTLKGSFSGWSNGTVLELENGQRWRVTEGNLSLGKGKTQQNPKVTIAPGLFSGWYLQVEGQNSSAKVQRLD